MNINDINDLNVKDGLTFGAMEASDEAIREQAKGRENNERSRQLDGSDATPDSIRASFFEPSGVRAGLESAADTDKWGHTAADREQILAEGRVREMDPAFKAMLAEASANSVTTPERAELEGRRQIERIENVLEAHAEWDIYEAPDVELVSRWAQLRPEDRQLMVSNGHVDREEAELLDQSANQLGDDVKAAAHGLRLAIDTTTADIERRQSVEQLARAQGWSDEKVGELSVATVEYLHSEGVGDLQTDDWVRYVQSVPPKQWVAALRAVGDATRVEEKALADTAWKQELLDTLDTNVSNGITQSVPGYGHQPLNPPPRLTPKFDYSQMRSRVQTDAEIKAEVSAESPLSVEMRRVRASADRERAAALKAREVFGAPLR